MESVNLQIGGMTCVNCVTLIEKKVKKIPGIHTVQINLASEKAWIEFDQKVTSLPHIKSVIESVGYIVIDPLNKNKWEKEEHQKKVALIGSAILTLPMIIAMIDMTFGYLFNYHHSVILSLFHDSLFQLVLTLPIQFYFGRQFYVLTMKAFKNRTTDMNVLVSLGTTSAFGLSIYHMLKGNPDVYFESSAVVITMVLFGKYLETRSRRKTGDALALLISKTPKFASVKLNDHWQQVPVSEIKPGMLVQIRSGENIPVDGIIISGESTIDESMMTGESLPVEKRINDQVFAGTTNQFSSLIIQTHQSGNETVLSKIIETVDRAQSEKAPVQQQVDKVSAIFVPVVLLISVVSGLAWYFIFSPGNLESSILSFVAVLVIACPCALGLATPTSMIVGMGKAAENGILFKHAESLETLSQSTVVVMDKTGTLTEGKPQVIAIRPNTNFSEIDILEMAAHLEQYSTHPIAKSIVEKYLKSGHQLASLSMIQELPGFGVKGEFNGRHISIGKPTKSLPEYPNEIITELICDYQVAGWIILSDQLKQDANLIVSELQNNFHIPVIILSGDRKLTVESMAKKLQIKEFYAEVLPHEKSSIIDNLKTKYSSVTMVGDGINDAPALASANNGISIFHGSDIAIEAGSVTLMTTQLSAIPFAIKISQQTKRNIQQNLFWAFIFNTIGIPFAASGLLTPWLAGSAMAFSSVLVVSNSLRLKRIIGKRTG